MNSSVGCLEDVWSLTARMGAVKLHSQHNTGPNEAEWKSGQRIVTQHRESVQCADRTMDHDRKLENVEYDCYSNQFTITRYSKVRYILL